MTDEIVEGVATMGRYWVMEINNGIPKLKYSDHSSLEEANQALPKAQHIANIINVEVAVVRLQIVS